MRKQDSASVPPAQGASSAERLGESTAGRWPGVGGLFVLIASLALASCAQAEATPFPQSTDLTTLPPIETTAAPPTTLAATTSTTTTTTTTTTLPPTTGLELVEVKTIRGDITPKSVVAAGNGLFFAQNMMYRHTITVYDDAYELVATIADDVALADDGASYQGSPVEAVPTSDGDYVYVSNYQMYGPGYSRAGGDGCNAGGWDESFVYRISTSTLEIDQVIAVGAVPKFLAITPDDSMVLVTNWCGFDMSVIDTAAAEEIARVPLGRHPRGIAVTSDGTTAYVAVMGSTNIAVVDLSTFEVDWIKGVGSNPRHLILDPTNQYLYATLNGDNRVIRIDLETGAVLDRLSTGSAPRSMTISDDGLALYVVNYESDTVAKIDAASMEVVQTLPVAHHPIGITFDQAKREVWVASYSGTITVFGETDTSQ